VSVARRKLTDEERKIESRKKYNEKRRTPEYKTKRKKYDSKPKNKARRKAYSARPPVKARERKRHSTPEYKEKSKKYKSRPEIMAREKTRRLTPEYKAKDEERRNRPENKSRVKKQRDDLKLRVFTEYSKRVSNSKVPVCACCGYLDFRFLAIDHIISRSKLSEKERKRKNKNLWKYLEDNGYPKGYQVYCHNCNNAKSDKIDCPHKLDDSGPEARFQYA